MDGCNPVTLPCNSLIAFIPKLIDIHGVNHSPTLSYALTD